MDVTFADDTLAVLEVDENARSGLGPGIDKAFRNRMNLIRRARDERDIFGVIGSKNFYRLRGDRAHQHALRLNDQWRLIIEIKQTAARIVAIED